MPRPRRRSRRRERRSSSREHLDRTHNHGGYHHRNHHRHGHRRRRHSPRRWDARWDLWDYAPPPPAAYVYNYANPTSWYVTPPYMYGAPHENSCMADGEARQVLFLEKNCGAFPTGPTCCPGQQGVTFCQGNVEGGMSVGMLQCLPKED